MKTKLGYRLPRLSVKLKLSNRAKLAEQVLKVITPLGFVTFGARSLCERHWKTFDPREVRLILEYLKEKKQLVKLQNGRYMRYAAFEEVKRRVVQTINQKGSLTVQDSKEILGHGRSGSIPVLEYLDYIGLTVRIGDARCTEAAQWCFISSKEYYRENVFIYTDLSESGRPPCPSMRES